MYKLTLTHSERMAIDWVGYRYAHGIELYKLLWVHCEQTPDDEDWDSPKDITFNIREHIAWQISVIGEADEYRWTCFAPELASKLNNFCMRIV